MTRRKLQALIQPLTQRVEAIETSLSKPTNAITFLLVRCLLMSAMVVGFSWYALNLSP